MAKIWNNSLAIIAILGLLTLGLANFVQKEKYLLLFGHFMSIVAFSVVFFYSFMILVSGKSRSSFLVLIAIGSGGLCFGYISQLMLDQVMDKPPVLHIASTLLAVGIIIFYNKRYYNG